MPLACCLLLSLFLAPSHAAALAPGRPGALLAGTKHVAERAAVNAIHAPEAKRDDDPDDVQKVGDAWVVSDVGTFSHKASYVFDGNALPAGLRASEYTTNQRVVKGDVNIPYNPRYTPANVQVANGVLSLKVPGGQHPTDANGYQLSCAEITTKEEHILYASVRTVAQFSSVPGTCHGMFFFKSNEQEIDIEYLTDPNSQSNNGPDQPIPIWYTNQAVNVNDPPTQATGAAPTDCSTAMHEYRIDWTADHTAFYLDGQLQYKYTTNVPSQAGPWVWNNWANGDAGWSLGPPHTDNVFQIQSVLMYYNVQA